MKSLILLLLTTTAFAADKPPRIIECPQAIFVTPKEDLTMGTPDGWNPREEPQRKELSGATLYDGRPEDKASLVPDKETGSGGLKALWVLTKDGKGAYWLECRYANSATVISKKVPTEATKCTWSETKKEQTIYCE